MNKLNKSDILFSCGDFVRDNNDWKGVVIKDFTTEDFRSNRRILVLWIKDSLDRDRFLSCGVDYSVICFESYYYMQFPNIYNKIKNIYVDFCFDLNEEKYFNSKLIFSEELTSTLNSILLKNNKNNFVSKLENINKNQIISLFKQTFGENQKFYY